MASEDEKPASGDGSGPCEQPPADEEEVKPQREAEEEIRENEVGERKEGDKEEVDGGEVEEKSTGRKRSRKKEEEGVKEAETQAQEEKKGRKRRKSMDAPRTPAVERPSRERKAVERFSVQTPRAVSAKKGISISQGSGTKLRDIPNVSFKLSKRKVDENLHSLHTILYGRKATVHYLKRNISQFSGFVWAENEEKQKNRIKEKLEKCNKEKLLDFCEILDIPVNRAVSRKEDILSKVFDFLESPHVTRDVVLTDKKVKGRKRQRSKGMRQGSSGEAALQEPAVREKNNKTSFEPEDDGSEDGSAHSDDDSVDKDDEDSEKENIAEGDDNEHDDNDEEEQSSNATVSGDKPTEGGTRSRAKRTTVTDKTVPATKSTTKAALQKCSKDVEEKKINSEKKTPKDLAKKASKGSVEEKDALAKKVSARSKKGASLSSKEVKKEGKKNSSASSTTKSKKDAAKVEAKGSTKRGGKGKTSDADEPSNDELRKVVSDILKEVDFNTATLADIIRQLGAHFGLDLMYRKSEVKKIIEEVINNMSDDEDGDEDEGDDDDADGAPAEDVKGDDADDKDAKEDLHEED